MIFIKYNFNFPSREWIVNGSLAILIELWKWNVISTRIL